MAAIVKEKPVAVESKNYKGFVAGVFSGIAKLTGTSFSIYIYLQKSCCPTNERKMF